MPGALSHIKVLDLSRVLAGPWCTQNLADLGADVIKVERPTTGDDTRAWGPPWLKDARRPRHRRVRLLHLPPTAASSRSRSTSRRPRARRSCAKLARKRDVWSRTTRSAISSATASTTTSSRASTPRLIYCSITGFGQTARMPRAPGYDFMIQGMGGLMSITGERDDRARRRAAEGRRGVADLFTGMYASVAILAALDASRSAPARASTSTWRCSTRHGRSSPTRSALPRHRQSRRAATATSIRASCPTRCSDRRTAHIIVAVGNDNQFAGFCEAAGHADSPSDPRFATNARARRQPRGADPADRARAMRERTTAEWVELIEDKAVPCGPINTYAQVFEDPAGPASRPAVRCRALGDGISIVGVASPLRLAGTPAAYTRRRRRSASTPTRCCRKSSARARTRSPHCANAASCERPPHNVAIRSVQIRLCGDVSL